ncbi:ATP-binding protein [Streptomyces sp. 4F14]|uniref:ATP-binding protein n=1 Tax=Streptomyces sp. 4F14 TaxID=3394380 RepID=UPI003A862B1F
MSEGGTAWSRCPSCGGPLPTGRPGPAATYCSNACRQRAHRRRRHERTARAQDSAPGAAGGIGSVRALQPATDSFVGREDDIAHAAQLLRRHRHITLVGPPGVGKSRLARELAHRTRQSRPGGVWRLDLGPGPEPDKARADLADTLRLGRLPALLLLDDCDEALDLAADLAAYVSWRWPSTTTLLTSREPVRLADETPVLVNPLPSAGRADRDTPLSAAVHLFVERARAVDPSFVLDPGNEDDVVRLCAHLDGLPLAIECAARRAGFFTPGEILERLGDGIGLLSGPGRRQDPREALRRSYRLLDRGEQAVLRRLSVLGTEFGLPDATLVCAGEDVPATEVGDLVARLAVKSLVSVADGRCRQLNVVRGFGREILAAEGEDAGVRDRWTAALVRDMERDDSTRPQVMAETLREACAWGRDRRPEWTGPLAVALGRCLLRHGHVRPSDYDLVRSARACVPPASPWSGPLLVECAALAGWVGDSAAALTYAQDGVDAARASGRPGLLARALSELGAAYSSAGELTRAARYLEESLAMDEGPVGACLYWLAAGALSLGDTHRCGALAARAVAALKVSGPRPMLLLGLHLAGHAAVVRGDVEHARACFAEGLDAAEGHVWAVGLMLEGLAVGSARDGHAAQGLYIGGAAYRLRTAAPRPGQGWDRLVRTTLERARAEVDVRESRRIGAAAARATVQDLVAYVRPRGASGDDPTALPLLAEGERDLLTLVGHGLTNAQIARRLRISPRAVAYRLTGVRQKLGLRSRTELAVWAGRDPG